MIPIHILKQYIGFPCILHENKRKHIGHIRAVELSNIFAKRWKVQVSVYEPEEGLTRFTTVGPDQVMPIVKWIDDITDSQALRLFKLWMENPTGFETMGFKVDVEVIGVNRIESNKFHVISKTIVTDPEGKYADGDSRDEDEIITINQGSLEFLPVPAFLYCMEIGVDVYGLIEANLGIHIKQVPGLVEVDGYILPIDSIESLGYKKEQCKIIQ